MKKKKLTALLLGLTLVLSSTCTAFAEENTSVTSEGSADVEVTAVVGSSFTIGIPTSVALNTETGSGSYDITVRGDIDPKYQLNVTPKDTVNTEDGINFEIVQQGVLINPASYVINVTDEKTTFNYSDINPTTDYTVHCTLQTKDNEAITTGTWKGTLTYDISLSEL